MVVGKGFQQHLGCPLGRQTYDLGTVALGRRSDVLTQDAAVTLLKSLVDLSQHLLGQSLVAEKDLVSRPAAQVTDDHPNAREAAAVLDAGRSRATIQTAGCAKQAHIGVDAGQRVLKGRDGTLAAASVAFLVVVAKTISVFDDLGLSSRHSVNAKPVATDWNRPRRLVSRVMGWYSQGQTWGQHPLCGQRTSIAPGFGRRAL